MIAGSERTGEESDSTLSNLPTSAAQQLTSQTHHGASKEPANCRIVCVVSFSQVGRGVFRELICSTHCSYTLPSGSVSLLLRTTFTLTKCRRCTTKPRECAESSNILPREGVLDGRDKQPSAARHHGRLDRCADSIFGYILLLNLILHRCMVRHCGLWQSVVLLGSCDDRRRWT